MKTLGAALLAFFMYTTPASALVMTTTGNNMQALYEFMTGNHLSDSDRIILMQAVEQDIYHGTPLQVKELERASRDSRDIFNTADLLITSRMRESLWPDIYFASPKSQTDRVLQILLDRSGQIVAADADSKTVITQRAMDNLFADNDFVAGIAGVPSMFNFDRGEAIKDIRQRIGSMSEAERQIISQSESRAIALRIMWQNAEVQVAAQKEISKNIHSTGQVAEATRRLETQAVTYVDGMTQAMREAAEAQAEPKNPALANPSTATTFLP